MNKAVAPLTAESEVSTAPHVLVAMHLVMEEIGKLGIRKDRRNKEQGYQFRGIDDVYEAMNPLLAKHRLLMLPVRMVPTYEAKLAKSGSALNYTKVIVDWEMTSALDGSSKIIQSIGEAMDSADKASNKAQSAAMKYAALMVFMIPTEGDNDADATTHQVASAEEAAINLLRGASSDKALFKTAWEANKDGWKNILDLPAYTRVVKVMKEVAGAFPPEEPPAPAPPAPPPPDERPVTGQMKTTQRQAEAPADLILDDEIPF